MRQSLKSSTKKKNSEHHGRNSMGFPLLGEASGPVSHSAVKSQGGTLEEHWCSQTFHSETDSCAVEEMFFSQMWERKPGPFTARGMKTGETLAPLWEVQVLPPWDKPEFLQGDDTVRLLLLGASLWDEPSYPVQKKRISPDYFRIQQKLRRQKKLM